MNDDEYEVGYGKPPKKNWFPKGTSGNPKGRRPNSGRGLELDASLAINTALDTRRKVAIGGKIMMLTMSETIAKRHVLKALGGHISSMRLVLRALPPQESSFTLVVIDREGNRTTHEPVSSPYGNEERRPQPLGSIGANICKELGKKTVIKEDGESKTVTVLQAIITRLVQKAAVEGNIAATEMLVKIFADIPQGVINMTPQFGTKVLKPVSVPLTDDGLRPGTGLFPEDGPSDGD